MREMMKNLAPGITRQRLLIEGFYHIPVNEKAIDDFFTGITECLSVLTGLSTIFVPYFRAINTT
jgi:hypothetical protein